MRLLAAAIRDDIDQLVDRYDAGLRNMPGYNHLPEAQRRDLERHVLNVIAQCLDAGDHAALVQYVQQRATQWETLSFPQTWFQQALVISEEILTPLIRSAEASNFLWRALNRSQSVVWQMVAERAHQTEERFRSIVETAHSGIMIVDDQFHFIYVNEQLTHLSGYSQAELLGADFRQLLDEDSRRIVADRYARRQRGEDVAADYEIAFIRKDGQKRYVAMSAVLLRDASGKPQTVAQVLDVSERKQAEMALARERSLLHTLIDSLPDQIFFKDTEGRVILNNMADARAMGVTSPAEAVGKNVFDLYPPELAAQYHDDDMTVIHTGQPLYNREEPSIDEAGQPRWTLTTKVPLTDDQGQPLGLVGIAHDITERRRTETALRENESKLRAIYEGSNDAIMLLNMRGFFDCNTQTLNLFGVDSKETFTRLHPSDLSPAYQPDGQDSLTASQHKIQTAYQQGYNRFDWVHRRMNGEDFPAEVLLSAFEYSGEQVLQATVRDITERKQAEAELTRSAEKQQQLTQRLRAAIEVADELMRLPDLDTVYRRAVELAREKLGVERCGLFVVDPSQQFVLGTYGTDDQGRTTDEHAARTPIEEHQTMFLSQEQLWIVQEAPQTHWQAGEQRTAGTGWVGGTAVRGEAGPIGVLYNDAAISRSPADPDLQEMLAVYCSMLGTIIESKRLEQELTAAQQQFQNIIEFLPDATFVIDRDKRVIAWNRAIEVMSGMAKEDILGKGDYEYALPFYNERRPIIIDLIGTPNEEIEAKYNFVQQQGDTLYAETFVPTMFGGRGAHVVVTASPLLDDAGNFAGAIESIRDVTERKQLELQIRESLAQRNIQVQTSVEIAQHIAAAPELEELFHRVVMLVKERFNYYHAQLFRYVPAEDAVVLITGYGEIGQKMLAAGHKLAMGRGVVGTAAATGQSILATDVAHDLDWRPNPNLPDTKGELAVPIRLGTGDAESQAHALKHFVNGNYDGIAVAAIDPEAIAGITHESLRQGKPIVAVSCDLGQDNQIALIFAIEHELGYLLGVQAGTWAQEHVPNSHTVKVGVLTYRTLPNVVERERGIIDGIQSVIGERMTIVVSESALEAKEAAYLAEGWLRAYPDLNMIVGYNDATALGAYQAAQNVGWHDPDQFFIGGIDAVPAALEAIQQGGVYQATVNQPPEVMGIMAVRTLIAAIKGLPVKPINALYCAPVNRSNAAEFLGPSRDAAVLVNQDIIPAAALAGLDVAGLRLGLSVLTLANPFFATLAASAQQEAQRLGVQLVINDPSQILGVLDVQSDQANTLTDDDRLLLEGLCGQIAIAIESKRLIDSAQQSERLMRTIIEAIPDNLYVKNRQSQFILANKPVLRQLGCQSLEDLVGKTDLDFYPPALAEKFLKDERAIFESGQPLINIEEPSLDAQGRPTWRLSTKVFRYNEAGEIEGLVGLGRDITARKQIEEALRRNEARLSEALKIAKLAYWEYDVENDLFHFNDQFYALFHTTVEQVGGYQISSAQYAGTFVYPDDLSAVGTEIERALNSTDRHYSRNLVHRIQYADGGVGYIAVNINIDRDENGKILRYYGANQDITERQLAEEAVRRSEAQLAEALKIAKLAYWEYDVENDLFHFNDQFYAIFHVTAEQAGGYQISSAQYAQQFVYPDDLHLVGTEIEKALNSTDRHYSRDLEHRIRYGDGGVGYIVVNINIDRDEQGKILRYYGANQDITERKRIEEDLRSAHAELAQAMDNVLQFESAFNHTNAGMAIVTTDGRFMSVNPALCDLLGYTREELERKRFSELTHPDDASSSMAFLRRALSGEIDEFRTEKRYLHKTGEVIWIELSTSVLRDAQQQPLYFVSQIQDIRQRKHAEVERERLLADQQKRTLQLQTASEVSRAASSILNLNELLPQAAELIRARFDLYYVGIFLLDETERWAILRAGTGAAGQHMLANSHKLKIGGNSMISQCVTTQQARLALDVGEEAVRFDNPLLPLTRSEMALPLVSRGRVIGAATIQSDQPAAFSAEDITVLQSMADQISNAVENARLYQQAQAALQEVDATNRRLTGEAWDTYLRQQAGRELIWLADDEAAAPAALSQLDEQLTAGEITVEPDPADGSAATVTAPILLRGQPIGALRLRTPLSEWDDDAEVMLADIAGHIAQAVENARLVEQTQRTAQRERTINEINARVRQSVDLDAILRTAVNELGHSLKAARVMARVGTPTAEDATTAAGDGRGKTND